MNDKEFSLCVERNLTARELERKGMVEDATKLYELNINENFEGNFPYDRLVIIYKKQKRMDDVVRVLKKAVYVFTHVVYKDRVDRIKKLEKFKLQLSKYEKL